MKTKRILAIILALVLTLSAIPFGGMITSFAKTIEEYSVGDIIEFGSYPQSKVTDTSLISALDGVSKSWISYGYYSGTGDEDDGKMTAKDYMKYADISYGRNKYRAVKFTSYRPYYTGYTCSSDYSHQDDNGYYTNNVYYFKYEPLKWRILDPSEGYIMCESIIDSQAFNNYLKYYNGKYYGNSSCTHYASDYANSSIRQWLNNDFYNTAFSSSEKSKIVTAEYENKSIYTSTYDSATTYDKITLLSHWDAHNSNYGFSSSSSTSDTARRAKGTDYAKCQGLWVCNGSSYYGNSEWRLRLPYSSAYTGGVSFDGLVYGDFYDTDDTNGGVRPAFKFNPKSTLVDDPTPPDTPDTPDTTKPTVSISSTSNLDNKQTVTLQISDNKSLAGYYWGTSATYSNNTFSSASGTSASIKKTVSSAGKYYLTAKDASGNVSDTKSITFDKIALNANQGTVSVNEILAQNAKQITLPTPTRKGYSFEGWFTGKNDGNRVDNNLVLTVSGTKTYYAHWKIIDYTVKFDANGGSCSTTSKKVHYNEPYGVLPVPVRSGYTFEGWYNAKSGGSQYTAESICYQTGEKTLYAHWKALGDKYVKGVSISDFELTYKDTVNASPSITADSGAKYTVSYSSSDENVAKIDKNGNITATGRGTATITCTVTDENGTVVKDTCKVTVSYAWWQWLIKIVLFGWIWY